MKPIEYQLPKKKQRVFGPVKKILRLFYKKIRVVTLGPKLDENCLLLANHANKKGPLVYELFLPIHCVKWGAHEMLETYKNRWRYLRDVLYMQKNGVKKFKATIKATFEATFSKFFYRGIKVLPTYRDARVRRTFVYSIEQVEGSTKLQNLQLDTDRRYAVVFGNEVKGVHQEVVDLADGCLEIPQFGTKHSLNVSVTAGIVIWEVAKQFLERLKL